MSEFHPVQPAGGAGGADPGKEAKKTDRGQPAGGPSFAEMLRDASGAERPGGGEPTGGAPAVQPPAAPYLGEVGQGSAAREPVLQTGGRFLELAEAYRDQLGNPATTLKDIAPLIREMEGLRDRMLEQIAALPQGDPGRDLLEEMAVLASSEAARFYRGDYI